MTSFEVYQNFIALKQHFTRDNYDYFRYQGKIHLLVSNYEKRKDKFFFEKLAKHRDPIGVLVANFIHNPKLHISKIDMEVYYKWQRSNQSLTYTFSQDIKQLHSDFNKNFVINLEGGENYPLIITLYQAEKLHFETLIILIQLTECIRHWDKHLSDDLVYMDLRKKIVKGSGFVKFERIKFIKIIHDHFKKNTVVDPK